MRVRDKRDKRDNTPLIPFIPFIPYLCIFPFRSLKGNKSR